MFFVYFYMFLAVAFLTGCERQFNNDNSEVNVNVSNAFVKYSDKNKPKSVDVGKSSDRIFCAKQIGEQQVPVKSKLRNDHKCDKISIGTAVVRGDVRPNSLEYRDKNTMFYVGSAMGTEKNSQKFAVEKRFSGGF